ncbi:MAG TPA: DUF2953 domain-containing protein [Bacillota bacterium]|nr:DUF2953 domain-containing protein [Bacillota bacterium]
MAWPYYLLTALLLCLMAAVAALFLPLRIFVFYLRENKEDRAALTVKICRIGFIVKFFRNGEAEVTSLLKLGKKEFRLPLFRRSGPGRGSVAEEMDRYEPGENMTPGLFSGNLIKAGLAGLKTVRSELKKMAWKRFDLEVVYGLEDPSWVGFTFGGGWALGGVVQGLLYHLFSFEAAPRFKIIPRYNCTVFALRWEGELTMPLFRGLKLLLLTRKIGGAISGSSSH